MAGEKPGRCETKGMRMEISVDLVFEKIGKFLCREEKGFRKEQKAGSKWECESGIAVLLCKEYGRTE